VKQWSRSTWTLLYGGSAGAFAGIGMASASASALARRVVLAPTSLKKTEGGISKQGRPCAVNRGETLAEMGRSYNVSLATISRLSAGG